MRHVSILIGMMLAQACAANCTVQARVVLRAQACLLMATGWSWCSILFVPSAPVGRGVDGIDAMA
jgi:hypothetical protein